MARILSALDRARVLPREVVDAKDEARRIVTDAETRARTVEEEARQRGREAASSELATAVARADAAYRAEIRALEQRVGELAARATERVVGDSLARDPTLVRAAVSQVFARSDRARSMRLRIHPDDAALARDLVAAIEARGARVEVDPDVSITRGGCVLITEIGELDARVESRLDAVVRSLTNT